MHTNLKSIEKAAVAAFSVLAAVILSAGAQAQAQNSQSVSNYYVAGTTQVSGWERGLVQNNPNLAQFHWSAIPSAVHARNVSGARQSVKGSPYHYVKPNVMALPGNSLIRTPKVNAHLRRIETNAGLIASAGRVQGTMSYGDVQGRLRSSNVMPTFNNGYETNVTATLAGKDLSGRVLGY